MIGNFVFSEMSPAAPGTVASANHVGGGVSDSAAGVAYSLADYDSVEIEAELLGATGGTLDVYIQSNDVDTGTWYDAIHFTQLTAGNAAVIYRTSLSRYSTATAAPNVIGKNLSPALTAGTAIQNGFGDRIRLVFVSGSGTTAGAVQKLQVTGFRTDTRRL